MNPTPTKIEPWMIEAAKEQFRELRLGLYLDRTVTTAIEDTACIDVLARIIARHAAPGAKTQEVRDELEQIARAASHGIPFYAYSDNEAACQMSHALGEIGSRLTSVIQTLHRSTPLADKAATAQDKEHGDTRSWRTGTPDVRQGKCETFWCCIEGASGDLFHRALDYANRHIMPLADGVEDAPKGIEPVPGSEEDFYWTGWHEKACDQCDTQWMYSGKVVAWMRLPKFAIIASTKEGE